MKYILTSIYLYFFYNMLYLSFMEKLINWSSWWVTILIILILHQLSKITLTFLNYLIKPYKEKLFIEEK